VVLLHLTVLPFLDYFYRPGALQDGPSFAGVANYRLIASSAVVTASQVCHFDVSVATRSTVSWFQVRDFGPLIDHMRQALGSRALDLTIYNLVVQNEGGPDLARWTTEGHLTGSRFLSWV